ncbi:TonB-dependent receptor [Rhizobium sp. CRIBSB]|nr:TonB-dependent receptor [Rhizobium sp. CRIBSB]
MKVDLNARKGALRLALHSSAGLGAMALALAFGASPGLAQTAAAGPQDSAARAEQSETNVDEIVVTATRIARPGFVAPTPLTTVGQEELEARGATHVRDVLYELPQVARAAPGGTGSANPGGQYVNLRNLGNSRTLVLIDGRRVVPTNILGNVDLNVVPSSLVERLEVVTGGASAAWGSDAVSGVVNLILKRNFEGVEGTVQYNISELGDNAQTTFELAAGGEFMDGRLRVMAAGEVSDLEGIADGATREWGQVQRAFILNPTYTTTNGQYRLIPSDNATFSRMTAGGVIFSGPLANTQFGVGGVPLPFVRGTNVASLFMEGGDGGWLSNRINLISPLERNTIFTRAAFDVSDSLTVYAEASRSYSRTKYDIITPYDQGTIRIQRDNAFLPAATRAAMVTANITNFLMGRLNYELGDDYSDGRYETGRFVLGADGELSNDWRWSAYYQKGTSNYDLDIGSRYEDNWLLGIDSVIHPTTLQPVCRSTLTNPTNGCVPINVFGAGSISPEAADYATGVGTTRSVYEQDVFAADLRGDLGATWAGPISWATGFERRVESLNVKTDADSQANRFRLGNAKPQSGEESVNEAYLESIVPLARDLPFAMSSDLNAAVRYTEYDLAGPATTWKVGLTHEFNEQVRLRVTRSRDIRAPKLNEMFAAGGRGSAVLIDPFTGTQPRVVTITTGNTNLTPETADTLTYGIVLRPAAIPGLQLAFDAYDIDISDAIGNVGAQQTIDRCFAGTASLCPNITRVAGVITEVTSSQQNFANERTRGFDIEAAYSFELDSGARMNFRLLASKMNEISIDDGFAVVDTAGEVGRDWRVSGNASYRDGPLTLSANMRYIGGGAIDNEWNVSALDVEDNYQDARAYFGASIQYVVRESDTAEITAFGRVDNLFDSDPPVLYATGQQPTQTNNALYDTVGRYYSFGLRFKFK